MNKYATEIGLQEKMDKFYRETEGNFDGSKMSKHATMDVGRSATYLQGLRYDVYVWEPYFNSIIYEDFELYQFSSISEIWDWKDLSSREFTTTIRESSI